MLNIAMSNDAMRNYHINKNLYLLVFTMHVSKIV